ncbi:MAG: transketolase [Nitrospirae bacterium]|nr:transketolase [Nitrospirota bacterium]
MNVKELERVAEEIRGRIIETSCKAGVPHLGSCLSCVDILTALYWEVLDIDPQNLSRPERDRFILSKGHAAPALFQVLAMKGFFPKAMMDDYGEDGSLFGEHPPACGIPGVEAATGSLGHGLPIGIGMALASRLHGYKNGIFVLLSDGECNEGSVWEAAMMAPANKLERLMAIIDFNKWQATGRSEEIMALSPLKEKWSSFGWSVYEVDGHDMGSLITVLKKLPDGSGKPVAVIAHTIKGKGVSFMEDDNNWHYRIPCLSEVETAKKELGLI